MIAPPEMRDFLAAATEGARAEATRAAPTSLKLADQDGPGGDAAQLGEPIAIIRIGLNSLKRSKKGAGLLEFMSEQASPNQMPGAVPEVIYPIILGDEVKGSVTLERQQNDTWKPTAFNNIGIAKALTDARQMRQSAQRSANERSPQEHYTGISVRALGLSFLAVLLDSGDLFIPLATDKELGLEKGVPIPAKDAMALLSKLANDYNDQPG